MSAQIQSPSVRQPINAPPIGARRCDITLQNAPAAPEGTNIVKDVVALASFSWLRAGELPTIVVPGHPPIWRGRELPVALTPGIPHDDDDFRRLGQYHMLSLVAAVKSQHPMYDFASVDIVADRNTLRKLLRWSSGRRDDFRVDVQVVKGTVLFRRCPPEEQNVHPTHYGFSFEREFTTAEGRPRSDFSSVHARIIQYSFAGFKMLVRYELDCVLPPKVALATPSSVTSVLTPPESTVFAERLRVVAGGTFVDQGKTVEMTSVKNGKFVARKETFFQMTLSGTPHLVKTRYEGNGIIKTAPTWETLDSMMAYNPEQYPLQLAELARALRHIVAVLKEHASGSDGRLSLVCDNQVLTLYARSTGDCLPHDMLALFSNSTT
ncbi:hypothetical protein BKA62DRAFT_729002 [Auriculariales sp. MPI-PUGE-AT-0066]|nr:hypothetical protein BKA62DRAFT_729002 [Auriculariales sp. MPI-PUGE-AT-0066]